MKIQILIILTLLISQTIAAPIPPLVLIGAIALYSLSKRLPEPANFELQNINITDTFVQPSGEFDSLINQLNQQAHEEPIIEPETYQSLQTEVDSIENLINQTIDSTTVDYSKTFMTNESAPIVQ